MSLPASISVRLEYQLETLWHLLKGFPEDSLRKRIDPEKWSVQENVAHLAVYQLVFKNRLLAMEREENPCFDRYVADDDPAFRASLEKSLKDLLEDIATQRFILAGHLSRLPGPILHRTGLHPAYGAMDIIAWTEFFLLHEAHHLYTIFQLTGRMRSLLQQ